MKASVRNIKMIGYVILYLSAGLTVRAALFWSPARARRFGVRLTSWTAKRVLRAMGCKVTLERDGKRIEVLELTPENRELALSWARESLGHFIVCNHLSYVDVLAISSVIPSVFVTSREVEETPFLGTMSKIGGSLFVERRNRSRLLSDIAALKSTLAEGFRVVVFPEGTSSNGEQVLPFKKSLLESARQAQAEVTALCINYGLKDQRPLPRSLRDKVFYYGDLTFGPHVLSLLSVEGLTIDIHWISQFRSQGRERDELTREVYKSIAEVFVPISPIQS